VIVGAIGSLTFFHCLLPFIGGRDFFVLGDKDIGFIVGFHFAIFVGFHFNLKVFIL